MLDDLKKIEIITNHIDKVRNNCLKLGKLLISENDPMGIRLIELGYCHDNSKFIGIEFEHLWYGSPFFLEALETHQLNNKHHPEYWGGINLMPELYIAEMVCDCWARAQEFGTDIRDWFFNTAKYKYDINEDTMQKIEYYLNLALTPKFN